MVPRVLREFLHILVTVRRHARRRPRARTTLSYQSAFANGMLDRARGAGTNGVVCDVARCGHVALVAELHEARERLRAMTAAHDAAERARLRLLHEVRLLRRAPAPLSLSPSAHTQSVWRAAQLLLTLLVVAIGLLAFLVPPVAPCRRPGFM
jgi:hypothetical protein